MNKKTLKNLIVRTALVLILSTTIACAMSTKNSELSKRFSDDLSESSAKKLIEEIYLVGSEVNGLVMDLEGIGFKCDLNKFKNIYCEKSHFLGAAWFIEVEVSGSTIDKIHLRKRSTLP